MHYLRADRAEAERLSGAAMEWQGCNAHQSSARNGRQPEPGVRAKQQRASRQQREQQAATRDQLRCDRPGMPAEPHPWAEMASSASANASSSRARRVFAICAAESRLARSPELVRCGVSSIFVGC